jgi:hypothetical protein
MGAQGFKVPFRWFPARAVATLNLGYNMLAALPPELCYLPSLQARPRRRMDVNRETFRARHSSALVAP